MKKNNELMLPVMEQFYTLQGEGTFSGQAAYFVRLSGCDVGCHWCDVKESWEIEDDQYVSIESIVDQILESGAKIAVITGGEPFTHNLESLTQALKQKNIRTHVETAGVFPITGVWDWICLSPKKFKPVLEEYYQKANELKVIVFNHSDFDWAQTQAKKCQPETKLYLQPEWSREPEISMSLVNFIKNNPEWILSLQIHKYLEIP
jgi:organic radical activating enzyme